MKNVLVALALAALPVLAQDAPAQPQQPCGAPKCCKRAHGADKGDMHKRVMEKFDANKDGQLDEQEKAAMKADFEARRAEMQKKSLEKFDANKDGQLDEQEKEAMKAEFKGRRDGKGHGPRAHKGPRHHKGHGADKGDMHKHMMEKFDANKDGQLDEQEKAAMKADFEARHAEMQKKCLEKFDANKDGQLDEQEKEAMKAEFKARRGKGQGCNKG